MALEYDWWEYFLIPWIAGAVGYFTNVLALQMTFAPLEFWGIELWRPQIGEAPEPWGFFGWQGIIPTKARKMASIAFDLMTTKLFDIHEIFQRLDPVRFGQVMEDSTLLMMDSVVNEVALKYMPEVWKSLPKEVKDEIVVTTDQEAGAFLATFMRDMTDHVEDVVDLKKMCVDACVEHKDLIVKIFLECGDKEFIFIRRSGFYFGFLFGCIQMVSLFCCDDLELLESNWSSMGT